MSDFYAVCFTKDDAHAAVLQAYRAAQALILSGQNALIECKPALEPIPVQLRRFLHGPVLGQISEQARVGGEGYTVDLWKEYYRKRLLGQNGCRWEVMKLPGQKRATPRRIVISTEELGTRAYAKFVDEIIQDATVELGVAFVFTNEEQQLLTRKPQRRNDGTGNPAAGDV